MIRPVSLAAAAVLSSALAFGAVASATAKPVDSPRHVHVTKESKPAKPAKAAKSAKVSKEARRLAHEQAKVAREVARKDAFLARVLVSEDLAAVDVTEAVAANIAADRDLLASLGAALASATTLAEVRAIATEVADVRPQVYRIAVDASLFSSELGVTAAANTTVIDDLAVQADGKEVDGFDVTDVRAALDAATVANTEAAAAADLANQLAAALTATSSKGDLAPMRAQLDLAAEALETVAAQVLIAEEALLVAPSLDPVVEPAPVEEAPSEPVTEPTV